MTKDKELLVLEYQLTKDKLTRENAVRAYSPLVEYIARKLAYRKDDMPDLRQVGNIGLLKSMENFDPSKEIAFSTFASSNIIGEIKHFIRDKSRLVKLPRKIQEHYSKIKAYIKEAAQDKNRIPTVREIAKDLDLPEEDVLEAMEAGQAHSIVSLDKPVNSNGDNSDRFFLIDSLGEEGKENKYLDKEILKQALVRLPEQGKEIIHLRYFEGLTQKEIAKRLNLSQMHISRLLNNSIKQLRKIMTP